MSLAIAEAGVEAAALLAALHRAGIGTAGPAWDEAGFAALLRHPGRRALIALAAGAPVGLVLVGVAADEAEILTLAVLPQWRRQGAGRALVEAALGHAARQGATRLVLEVAVRNAPARALYAALGFAEIARRRAYYAGGEDALVLARPAGPAALTPSS